MLTWEELTEPERAVWNAVEAGSLVELPLAAPAADDPAKGETWGQDRQIRAQLLYQLLAGVNGPTKDAHPRALKLAGARITGSLDLEATSLLCPLVLRRCSFEQPINLQDAQAPAMRLPGCRVPGLNAEQFQTRVNLGLNQRFAADGEVNLTGAHIGGTLNLDGAILTNPSRVALRADWLTVDGAMFGRHGFRAEGEMRLLGAHIAGQLDLHGAALDNPGGRALDADQLIVDQHMLCVGFTANGEVNLLGAKITGQLNFDDATVINPGRRALDLQNLEAGPLFLRYKVPPEGEVVLTHAHVGALVESQASWPDQLRLNGLVYGALYETQLSPQLHGWTG